MREIAQYGFSYLWRAISKINIYWLTEDWFFLVPLHVQNGWTVQPAHHLHRVVGDEVQPVQVYAAQPLRLGALGLGIKFVDLEMVQN